MFGNYIFFCTTSPRGQSVKAACNEQVNIIWPFLTGFGEHPKKQPYLAICSKPLHSKKSGAKGASENSPEADILNCFGLFVNSFRPSDAYMCRLINHHLVQIMTCHLVSAKPLFESMLEHCSLDFRNKIQWNSESKFIHLKNVFENAKWKMLAILSWPQCVNIFWSEENHLTSHYQIQCWLS